ncbi:tetranectin-like, partial [Ylistrum balloti]|uniref:tetranectin-like n=1 Tax=Ylistrum balloti TaxID=509963 RepID=UPI002905D2C1
LCDGTSLSGYWSRNWNNHWYNTSGDVVYTTTACKVFDCTSICLEDTDCLMFGYSNVTGTCHGFRFLEYSTVSILDESEVIYKHIESCIRAGYVLLKDRALCLKKHDSSLTWDEAQEQCENEYGRLPVIDSLQKYEAFVNYIDSISDGMVWLGVNDKVEEGTWVWLDGTTLDTSYWSYVQLNDYSSGYTPNKFTAECARTNDGGIVDDHCLLTFTYLCERPDLV